MQVDESITDIYDGMANGSIRLADAKPVVNEDGKPIQVKGRTLFEQSAGFVSAAVNKNGEHETLDAWSFETREPQSIESILSDYQDKLDRYFSGCETEADIKLHQPLRGLGTLPLQGARGLRPAKVAPLPMPPSRGVAPTPYKGLIP